MPHTQQSIVDPPIRCVSCTKIIAQGNMSVGRIIIRCKCGVENVIEARNKPEGLKYVIGHEPSFDGKGRLTEVSMVLKRAK